MLGLPVAFDATSPAASSSGHRILPWRAGLFTPRLPDAPAGEPCRLRRGGRDCSGGHWGCSGTLCRCHGSVHCLHKGLYGLLVVVFNQHPGSTVPDFDGAKEEFRLVRDGVDVCKIHLRLLETKEKSMVKKQNPLLGADIEPGGSVHQARCQVLDALIVVQDFRQMGYFLCRPEQVNLSQCFYLFLNAFKCRMVPPNYSLL